MDLHPSQQLRGPIRNRISTIAVPLSTLTQNLMSDVVNWKLNPPLSEEFYKKIQTIKDIQEI